MQTQSAAQPQFPVPQPRQFVRPQAAELPDDMRILLVDDDDICAMSFACEFARQNIINPIHRAKDGNQALTILRAARRADGTPQPHLILLDLKMPGMGGMEFLQVVANDPALQAHPIFVLTTSDMPTDPIAALAPHIAAFVYKDQPAISLAHALNGLR